MMRTDRRSFLAAATAAACWPGALRAAPAEWVQPSYQQGWPPGHDWTFESYRVGNYSGGFETMFPVHAIAASGQATPLTAAPNAPLGRLASAYLNDRPATGLLIARKGTMLFEGYQFERTAAMRMTSWSMAKSVTSLLLGICLDRGLVRSMDDPPQNYVEELKGTLHGSMAMRHLANMSSGASIIHDKDNATIYPRGFLGAGADFEPIVRGWNNAREAPGRRFNYNELCPLTIGMVIRRVTGMSLAAFCQEALWQPLGAEAGATWLCDAHDHEFNCIGFAARLRDWARLGQMVAQGGAMEGRQIVSTRWLDECASWSEADAQVRVNSAGRGFGYKYFWWHLRPDGSLMMMNGHHGQRLLVDRHTQTVMVHTAVAGEGGEAWGQQLLRLFDAAVATA